MWSGGAIPCVCRAGGHLHGSPWSWEATEDERFLLLGHLQESSCSRPELVLDLTLGEVPRGKDWWGSLSRGVGHWPFSLHLPPTESPKDGGAVLLASPLYGL